MKGGGAEERGLREGSRGREVGKEREEREGVQREWRKATIKGEVGEKRGDVG